jgi:hypothetical protein
MVPLLRVRAAAAALRAAAALESAMADLSKATEACRLELRASRGLSARLSDNCHTMVHKIAAKAHHISNAAAGGL